MNFVGINKLSLLDYPGKISCILYTSGCNMRCPFCHNGLTLLSNDNEEIPFEDILSFLKKRVGILEGVVISGGEPTLLHDLKEKIKAIKDLGFLVKLDTNGTNPEIMLDLINNKLIDYVAMDIKNTIDKYPITCGNPNIDTDKILKSIEILKSNIVDYEFRTTLIDEFHNEVDMMRIGQMLEGANKLYLQQFKISDGVINKNLHSVSEDSANKFVKILSKYIKLVELRGY